MTWRRQLGANGFPALEASPVVLFGGANLIGKAEAVGPAFLLGAPLTIPDEGVRAWAKRRVHVHGADEVGAAGSAAERHVFDREVRFGRQDVREKPPHLDPRRMPFDANRVRAPVPDVPPNSAFEGFRGVGLRQDQLELAQSPTCENESSVTRRLWFKYRHQRAQLVVRGVFAS